MGFMPGCAPSSTSTASNSTSLVEQHHTTVIAVRRYSIGVEMCRQLQFCRGAPRSQLATRADDARGHCGKRAFEFPIRRFYLYPPRLLCFTHTTWNVIEPQYYAGINPSKSCPRTTPYGGEHSEEL